MKILLVCAAQVPSAFADVPPEILGDTITYRGETYDFSPLIEGADIEVGLPFTEPVKRINGKIEVSLEYFFSPKTALAEQSINSDDYIFEVVSGQCPCPIKRKPAPDAPMEVTDE